MLLEGMLLVYMLFECLLGGCILLEGMVDVCMLFEGILNACLPLEFMLACMHAGGLVSKSLLG